MFWLVYDKACGITNNGDEKTNNNNEVENYCQYT